MASTLRRIDVAATTIPPYRTSMRPRSSTITRVARRRARVRPNRLRGAVPRLVRARAPKRERPGRFQFGPRFLPRAIDSESLCWRPPLAGQGAIAHGDSRGWRCAPPLPHRRLRSARKSSANGSRADISRPGSFARVSTERPDSGVRRAFRTRRYRTHGIAPCFSASASACERRSSAPSKPPTTATWAWMASCRLMNPGTSEGLPTSNALARSRAKSNCPSRSARRASIVMA